jgi:hypothetical protein
METYNHIFSKHEKLPQDQQSSYEDTFLNVANSEIQRDDFIKQFQADFSKPDEVLNLE